jgi:hypothetical protein
MLGRKAATDVCQLNLFYRPAVIGGCVPLDADHYLWDERL